MSRVRDWFCRETWSKVVKLGEIQEKDWEEALKEIEKEGYGAVVAVDMGGGGLGTTSTSTSPASVVSTPEPDTSGDQTAAVA
ncbi:hypothetical protein TGAMA5MH_10046 [Trichoderma gamsii]|uniref:Uncharacterized protein n=1 Tax=Trichoderma gamsii TaxID=398673 RepID=A0A2K0SXE6_9HYPO|nr:hypothetical protein TGAMA5MH_10046 [Trichoderma gamsii]